MWYLTYRTSRRCRRTIGSASRSGRADLPHLRDDADEQETIVEGVLDEYGPAGHDASLPGRGWRSSGSCSRPPGSRCTRCRCAPPTWGTWHPRPTSPTAPCSQPGTCCAGCRLSPTDAAAGRRDRLIHRRTERSPGSETRPGSGQGSGGETADRLRLGRMFHRHEPGPAAHAGPHLLRQLATAAQGNGDDLTWLLLGNLAVDADRCARWSIALARTRSGSGRQPGRPAALGSPVDTSRRGRRGRARRAVRAIAVGRWRGGGWENAANSAGAGYSRGWARGIGAIMLARDETWQVVMPADDSGRRADRGPAGREEHCPAQRRGEIRAFEDRCPTWVSSSARATLTGAR